MQGKGRERDTCTYPRTHIQQSHIDTDDQQAHWHKRTKKLQDHKANALHSHSADSGYTNNIYLRPDNFMYYQIKSDGLVCALE